MGTTVHPGLRRSPPGTRRGPLGQDQDDDIYTQIEKKRSELKKFGGQIIDGVLKPLTPVSYDSFVAWKERKDKERRARELEESRVAAMKAAKEMRGKSGRDLMAQLAALGNVFEDDDEADASRLGSSAGDLQAANDDDEADPADGIDDAFRGIQDLLIVDARAPAGRRAGRPNAVDRPTARGRRETKRRLLEYIKKDVKSMKKHSRRHT